MVSDSADLFDSTQDLEDQQELQGKIQDYLGKLNEILTEYERQRVIESALLNLERFNMLLQAFMDLPDIEQLLEMVREETDAQKYKILSAEVQAEILELETVISDN